MEKGKIIESESLSRDEHLHFGKPFGAMEAFCTAGGLSTLVDDLADQVKTLDHKTIRWPGHADQMRFLIGLGFANKQKIDVRTHLTYRDVLMRRMKRRLGGEHEDAVLMRVLVKGKKEGSEKTLVYEMIELYDKDNQMTAIQRTTSIPAATVACMVGSGSVNRGGAAPAENVVNPDAFLDTIADRGLVISKKWYDKRIPVTSEELGLSPVSS